ncbi:MAG: oligosaccharide flippase family protein [Acidobacteria bacterium]|nr:oligosaccharide flippase family protein [Acidobacteriota bacterium]
MAARAEGIGRHHVSAFFSGGMLSLTRLATGFVRIKYVALVLGTAGVGFLSQATQLQLLGISIASLSMAVGIINRMGALGGDRSRESRLLSTAFTAQTTISLTLLAGAIVFAGPLVQMVFGAEALAGSPLDTLDVVAVVCSVPLAVVASGYLEAVFFGAGRYDLYVRASIWATLLGFAATIALIYVWRLPGAFWSIFASAAVLAGAFVLHVRRVRPFAELFRPGFDRSEANALVRFSIAVLVSGALVPTARLWVQRAVISSFGIEANGLLQVPFAVNAYYTPFLTNALWGRMHPAVTRLGPTPAGRRELTTGLRLTMVMATAAIVAILFLKDLLVPLAYSREFMAAARLLPPQLVGDFFYFAAFPFTVYALGLSRLRVYLAAWVGYSAVAVSASFVMMRWVGLAGVPIGYGIGNAIGALVAFGWYLSRRDEGTAGTLAIAGIGLALVVAQGLLAWTDRLVLVQGLLFAATSAGALAWLWRARAAG